MAYANTFIRREIKYLLSERQTDEVLLRISSMMTEDCYSDQTICSLYCDSADHILAQLSMDKPVYKEKLRLRTYGTPVDSSDVFLEIKKKFQGVVYKRRAEMTLRQAREYLSGGEKPPQDSQILREIDYTLKFHDIHPMVCLCYERVALYGKENPDLRITFDTGIRFRTDELDLGAGARGQNLLPPGGVLMEIKIPGTTPLWLARALSENAIFPTHFSKYGAAYQTMLRESRSPQFGSETIHLNEKGEIYCA